MSKFVLPPRLTKPYGIVDTRYAQDLSDAVDVLFERATFVLDWSWADLAKEANLSYGTVCRLGDRETRLPRWQTIWKLACAVGLQMTFVDRDGHVLQPQTHLKIYSDQSSERRSRTA